LHLKEIVSLLFSRRRKEAEYAYRVKEAKSISSFHRNLQFRTSV